MAAQRDVAKIIMVVMLYPEMAANTTQTNINPIVARIANQGFIGALILLEVVDECCTKEVASAISD